MKLVCIRSLAVILVLAIAACSGDDGVDQAPDAGIDAAPDASQVPEDIADFLELIPGLTFTEESTRYSTYRRFTLDFVQPVDHANAGGKTFTQRAVLHHRERTAPFVLFTSGYYLYSRDSLAELSGALGANQLDVEQRFFSPSTPNPTLGPDWDQVRIEQAATDHHRWVELLSPYYTAKWLSTGHSKGGMTSIYHRRFFPEDVDATIAYVAPISFAAGDTRYHAFFDGVADASCRQALDDLQSELLTRRAAMLNRLDAGARASGQTFLRTGGLEIALEESVIGLPWSFFQYGNAADCPSVPPTTASDDELYDYLIRVSGVSSDSRIETFATYFYQAEAELGYPSVPEDHLTGLIDFPDAEIDLLPSGVSATLDTTAMADVDRWIKDEASEMLFVYGEFDPWFGGAFELGPRTTDSLVVVVPAANHGALLRDLPLADRDRAVAAIERWIGVRPDLFTAMFLVPPRPFIPRIRPRFR